MRLLLDVDYTYVRLRPAHPAWDEITGRYLALPGPRGNDRQTGVRLADLLRTAGLAVEGHVGEIAMYP